MPPAITRSFMTPSWNTIRRISRGWAQIAIESDGNTVFGSRFAGGEVRRVLLFPASNRHKLLTCAATWRRISIRRGLQADSNLVAEIDSARKRGV